MDTLLSPEVLYPVLAAVVGVLATRFPVVGPGLKWLLDYALKPAPKPAPSPSPGPGPTPAPGPSPGPAPVPAPSPLADRPVLDALMKFLRRFLEERQKAQAMAGEVLSPDEQKALVLVREHCEACNSKKGPPDA